MKLGLFFAMFFGRLMKDNYHFSLNADAQPIVTALE